MTGKLLLISIGLILISHKIEYVLFNIKKNIYSTPSALPQAGVARKNYLPAEIISNKWTTLTINKGQQDGITVNMLVEGEKGFLGTVHYVGEDYSIIKTFWYKKWELILIDDHNNYSPLKSHGYFLTIKNTFADGSPLYLVSEYGSSPFGYVKKMGKISKVYPLENILHVKRVYIKK